MDNMTLYDVTRVLKHYQYPLEVIKRDPGKNGLIPRAPKNRKDLPPDLMNRSDPFLIQGISATAIFHRKGIQLLRVINQQQEVQNYPTNDFRPALWDRTLPNEFQSLELFRLFLNPVISTVQDSRLMVILLLFYAIEDAVYHFGDKMGGVLLRDHLSQILPFARTLLYYLPNTSMKFYLKNLNLTFEYWMAAREVMPKVGVIILSSRSRILLIKESRSKLWGMIKGSLKPGESLLEGACRETAEESFYFDIARYIDPALRVTAELTSMKTLHLFIATNVPEMNIMTNCEVMDSK